VSEEPGRGEWKSGCLAGGFIGGCLAAILVVAIGAGMLLYYRHGVSNEDMALPASPADSPATVDAGSAENDAAPPGEEEDNCIAALPVLVKLAGVNDKGEVRYLLDRQDEVVGDAALVAALKKRLEAEKRSPDEELDMIVDLDVATASGITLAQVDAAVKACWAAGASVLPPPDISKEKAK